MKRLLPKAISGLLLGTILGPAFWLPVGAQDRSAGAQGRHIVSGRVRDKATGEVLIGASVSLLEIPRSGILSNAYGFYAISAPAGKYMLLISFTGYLTDTPPVTLDKNVLLPGELRPAGGRLEAVEVRGQNKNDNFTPPLIGVQKPTTNKIKNIPMLFGKKEVLKIIKELPGI